MSEAKYANPPNKDSFFAKNVALIDVQFNQTKEIINTKTKTVKALIRVKSIDG